MKQNKRIELYGNICEAINYIENCKEFSYLIPEARTNVVYAASDAEGKEDVIGIDGRITIVNGMPYASGKPKLGISSHMARLIIELMKFDQSIRAGINFICNPDFMNWLKDYCKEKGWQFSVIDSKKEPKEIREKEGASIPWKVQEIAKSTGSKMPKIFCEVGAVGKEDLTVLVGSNLIEVVKEACAIAKLYLDTIQPRPKVGKIDVDTFTSFLLKRLGKKDRTVIVPPFTGIDAGVIDIGNNKVLIIAEDPIFSIPKQPLEMFGWYTVHIGASDVAVMGVKPKYMTYTLLMPPETSKEDFAIIINSIHNAAIELDIAIVGGHTGYYPGFSSPTIGGITVFSIADINSYVTPAGANADDNIILTKGPAIEAVGILSVLREEELLNKYPSSLVKKAQELCKQMTVVKDALIAMEAGGVTAMHDATEGGVIGGLFEIANASNVGMEIDESLFIYPEEVNAICEFFNIDPIAAIAEGSLLITAKPSCAEKIINDLKNAGIKASVIGKVTKNAKKRYIKRLDGRIIPLAIPSQDPFWPAFFQSLKSS